MKSVKHILWATDFSAESKAALNWADFLAKKFQAELTALHVVPDFSPALYETLPELRAELLNKIEGTKMSGRAQINEFCRAEGVCPTQVLVREGAPARVIVDTAEKEKTDLVVIGRKGASDAEGSLIGSVAHKILRSSPVPVLVAKKAGKRPEIKNILVPTDFTSEEDVEREYAWMLASKLGADLTFLYVLELFGHDFRLTDEMFQAVLKKLQARRKREHSGVNIKEEVTRAVNAAEGIIDHAERHGFDLIVMSTVVRKLPRLLLGSTTEKVIRYSALPVLALPAHFD
jgi:nucleotide-binding universal stress UspA family protein